MLRAAENGDDIAVEFFLAHGANPNTGDLCEHPLRNAVKYPHVLQQLIEHGAEINYTVKRADCFASTPLITSAFANYADSTRYLLEHGAEPNVKDQEGKTALEIAKEKGNEAVIRVFDGKTTADDDLLYAVSFGTIHNLENALQQGANINAKRETLEKETALILAVQRGEHDIIRFLLEHGANPNQSPSHVFPLEIALKRKDLATAELLLNHSADVNQELWNRGTLVADYADAGNIEMVKFLLQHGANIQDALNGVISGAQEELITLLIEKYNADAKESLLGTIYDGNPEIIELLLQHGADVNVKDDEGLTPLMQAASFGEYEIAQILIRYGADVDMMSDEGQAPLLYAIRGESGSIVRLLLEHGANANKIGTMGVTALMFACQQENTDIVRLLFQYDIDVNATTEDGYTTLMAAIGDTDEAFETVRRLLEKGADVNVRNGEGETALFFAADKGMFDIVSLLHEYGADMSVKNLRGKTALIETLQAEEQTQTAEAYWKNTNFGDEETKKRKRPEFARIAEFLIAHDVDVNARDSETNMTALMFAAMCGENGIMKQLLALGAEVNIKNEHETAFMLAIRYRQKESAKLLLRSGAIIQTIDGKDITSVVNAIFNEQQTSLSQYLKNGIDIHIEVPDESSLLLYAVIAGNIAAVEALIEHGADISLIDRDGKNALLTAIDIGDIAMVKTLLQKGADVNGRIKMNEFTTVEWTPLMYAAQSGQKKIVQLLLDFGADVKIRTKDGLTVTTFARPHDDIMILLLEAGADFDPIPR